MSTASSLRSRLPSTGVSIFSVMSRLADEHDAINLSQGFPDFDCAPTLVDAVAAAMRAGHNQYAPMAGVPALREALARKIAHLYGHRYDPATEITVTSGATEALFSAITALVHPGDEVIIFVPAYDSYAPAVQLSGGVPVFVPLHPPDWRIDWDRVRAALTPRTRLVLLNTPHNPTGMTIDRDDVRQLADVLDRSGALALSDEVYEHIVFDGRRHESLSRHPELARRSVVVSSFGKTYHATGWKVGYCVAPREITAEIQRIHQFVTFTVNGAVQMAYAGLVDQDPACAEVATFYQARRDRFLSLMEGSRFRPLACQGTYFQLMEYSAIADEPDTDFSLRLIREHGVAAIPTSAFMHGADPGRVLRFCFAKRDETLVRAAERLRAI
ncbi:MAG: methionine aminotransferase [Acidobacteria bacterium]|nr:methionine aminotransferase [Acidobacteriota bacterium]